MFIPFFITKNYSSINWIFFWTLRVKNALKTLLQKRTFFGNKLGAEITSLIKIILIHEFVKQ